MGMEPPNLGMCSDQELKPQTFEYGRCSNQWSHSARARDGVFKMELTVPVTTSWGACEDSVRPSTKKFSLVLGREGVCTSSLKGGTDRSCNHGASHQCMCLRTVSPTSGGEAVGHPPQVIRSSGALRVGWGHLLLPFWTRRGRAPVGLESTGSQPPLLGWR